MRSNKIKNKHIAVLARRMEVKTFLAAFFRAVKDFMPHYCDSAEAFPALAAKNHISAVLVEDVLLPSLYGKFNAKPVIAILTGNKSKGIEDAKKNEATFYIHKPYLKNDLAHMLQSVIRSHETSLALQHKVDELKIITELHRLISSSMEPKELLYRIVKKISEVISVTRCSIVSIDRLHRYAYVVASHESPGIANVNLRINLKKYPEIREALKLKKPIMIKNITKDPIMDAVRDIITPLGISSIIVLPIFFEDKIIGTLFLRTSRVHKSFSQTEINLLKTIAEASANTLYNAYLFAQVEDEKTRLEKLSITDYMTGIFNIRYFHHRIIEEFNRSERYNYPISCIMLDIDYFKKINDTYGHKIGDKVLREFAHILKKSSRNSDVLARYGGEEFIVMLPQTPAEGAVAEAERFRNTVKKHAFQSLKNKTGITVSIGISTFPNPKIKTQDELISAADDALYDAKNGGRDRFVVFQ